ncbi:AAA family ATPase [Streptomyces sp. NPDC007905]|uniref:AAA family ATPase n=1 Tax=Streptomyces sp. NPDC007905 TaxID=3364788 RepID=UPI0036E6F777
MGHTGGEVRQNRATAGDERSTQRVLLTMAVRDYGDDDNAEEFAEGIDRQLEAVQEWWQTPGSLPTFRQVDPPALRHRDDVEDFLREQNVREMCGHALVLFISGHGISASSDTHFLRLPASVDKRPLATAVRTADIVAAALDSHVENVLVIVNTCFAGNMASDLAAVHKEVRGSRQSSCQLDVLVTCGLKSKIEVLRFPTLLQASLKRLRRTAGITTPHLTVPDFMAEYALGLRDEDEKKYKLHHLIEGGNLRPSPCLPNPGYVHMPELVGAVQRQASLAADYWLDRATGRPQESDRGWYFRGREHLNRAVASFLGPDTARGVLLVTGCAGSGKSAVLARAVILSDSVFRQDTLYKAAEAVSPEDTIPPEDSVSAAVLARHLDAAQVAAALLDALKVPAKEVASTGDRVAVWSQQIQEYVRTCGKTVTIVLDGLDEAQEQARIIGDVLGPLVSFCGPLVPAQRQDEPGDQAAPAVRLLIGVRSSRMADDAPREVSEEHLGLLAALRKVFPTARVEHTDSATSKEDMALYLEALIADAIDSATMRDVVPRVVQAVWPSFIDARLAGDQLRSAKDALALARDEDWYKNTLKRGIRGLLQRDLQPVRGDALPPHVALALLKAAAYAKGQGVPWGEVWPTIAGVFLLPERLDPEEWDKMIEKLLSGRLSGYLAHAVEDDRRVYRPAHEELSAVLLDPDANLLTLDGPHA